MQNKHKPQILLVDDKQGNLEVLIEILHDLDTDMQTADSGNMALELILKQPFELVLLDVQMPEMDGFETAQLIRSHCDTPIIFLTAHPSDQYRMLKGYKSGAVDFLVKPYHPDILKSKVSVFLSLGHQKRLLEATNQRLSKEIVKREKFEKDLIEARNGLEERVKERSAELALAYKDLKRSEDNIRLVINHIPAMIVYINKDRVYEYANSQYIQGVAHGQEVKGKHFDSVLESEASLKLSPYMDKAFNGEHVRFEMEVPVQGNKFPFLSVEVIPHVVEGRIQGIFALIQEITEQRRERERMELIKVQLRQARRARALATLAGGISHEFNNLLVPIMGFAQMIQKTLPKESKEIGYMDRLINSSYRAKDIIGQMQLFSLKKKTTRELLESASCVRQSLEPMKQLIPSNIHLKTKIDDDSDPFIGDPTQVQQMLWNICQNAIDAMPQGGELTINLFNHKKDHLQSTGIDCLTQRCVCLVVEDTGHGMDEAILEQAFNPFFSTRRSKEHIGLGLSIVLSIAEQMDGHIDIQSQMGKGTRSCVMIPAT